MLLQKTFLAAALAASLSVPAHAEPQNSSLSAPLPVTSFTKKSTYRLMKVSPTGEYLAATVQLPGEDNAEGVAIIRRKDMKLAGGIRFQANQTVDNFVWVNDERLVVSNAEKKGWLDRPLLTGDLFAVNADGSKQLVIYGPDAGRAGDMQTGSHLNKAAGVMASGEVLDTLPDNDDEILIVSRPFTDKGNGDGTIPKVLRLNVYTGKSRLEAGGPVRNAQFLTDADSQLKFAGGVDALGRYKVFYKPEADKDWQSVGNFDSISGEGFAPIGFAADAHDLLVLTSLDGGPETLFQMDPMKTFKDMKPLLSDGVSDPSGMVYGPHHNVIALEFTSGETSYQYVDGDAPLAKFHRSLVKAFGGQKVEFTSFTKDGREAVAFVHSDRNPGDFYLVNTETKKADYLASESEWLDPEQMVAKQPIVVKARDGKTLHGYLSLPKGGDGKNLPMIVLPHGGPHGIRDDWEFDPEVQLLANHGYAVLQINFRGSGGYGVDFMTSGYGQWGLSMQDDVTDATRWAIAQGIADKDRICIYGGSYGGYAAMMGVIREPDLYRCAVTYAGVSDLPLMFKTGDSQRGMRGVATLKQYLGEDEASLKARSPVYNVDKVKVPVMIIHGGMDERVPPEHAEELRDALQKQGKSVEWLFKPSESHGFYTEADRTELYTKLLAFLEKNIGAGVTRVAAAK